MKKRKAGRFVALFLVCLLLLGLVPTDVQRPLYNEGAVSAAGQAFSDGDTAPVQDPVNLVPVQSGTVTADEDGGSTEIVPAEAKSGGTENNAGFTDTEKSQPEDSGSLEQNQNPAQTPGEGETPEENPTPEILEGTPEGDGADQETPDDTFTDGGAGDETPEEKPDKTAPEASDGNLGNTAFYFADKFENSSVSGVWAVFDGGADEAAEVQLQMGEDGYYAGTIPVGDYSRLTFQIADADGVRTAITPSYRYYEGQSALENTQTVLFQKDVLDTYYYCPESNSYWAVRENVPGATPTPAPSASPTPTPEAEENRITEPSDGSRAGQEMHFVNLYWEDQDMGDVYALFQGGESEDQAILMSRGDRGKYTVTVPDDDHSRVSFAKLIGAEEAPEDQGASDGQDEFVDQGAAEAAFLNASTAENNLYGNNDGTLSVNGKAYVVLGNSFQYYNVASAASNCTPVAYCPDSFDTYYYDAEVPARSYWGADALYEPPIADNTSSSSKPMRAPMAGAEDTNFAGQTLYFVDMTEDEANSVKRVTMQFYKAGHETGENPDSEMLMYEGRTNIFSAPIPEENYEEVTFKLEYMNGDSYTLTRHYNIYTQGNETAGNGNEENFLFVQGEMDTFFYTNHPENTDGDAIDSYWGPHPSVTDRSLDAQYLYINTKDVNGDHTIMNPGTMTINYGKGDEKVTLTTRDGDVRAFQFPLNSGATENTVITLKGKTGYLNDSGEVIPSDQLDPSTQPETEIIFKFYYPYNSDKKMIVTDNIRATRPVFEEFILEDAEKIYVIYDNTSTKFTNIQYRVKEETGVWTDWKDLKKTDPNAWTGNKNEAIVENLWGAEVGTTYKYVQFRGNMGGQNTQYLWRSTEATNADSLALIPATKYSYPCFYGGLTEENGSQSNVNIKGRWLSALDVRNLGDDTVYIPADGEFKKDQDTYYGTSTFYDYYSDSQITGTKLKENDALNIANTLNRALSKYYDANDPDKKIKPFYVNVPQNATQGYDRNLHEYNYDVNNWTEGKKNYVTSGLVDSNLKNGELMAGGIKVPQFDSKFLRGDNSAGANLAQIYNNVYFPFKKGENGYWEFDSAKSEQTLRMKYDANNGYYLERTGEAVYNPSKKNQVSFFPFNDPEDTNNKRHINYSNFPHL